MILVDTTPVVALCDARDFHHASAVKELENSDRRLKVWTYDREFHSAWRRPDGSAIPLAIRA